MNIKGGHVCGYLTKGVIPVTIRSEGEPDIVKHPRFVAMEWFDMGTFEEDVTRNKKARSTSFLFSKDQGPTDDAIYHILQVAIGLMYMHERGYIHKDIKPSNILRVRKNDGHRVAVCDLGLARKIESGMEVARAGTLNWRPPEVEMCSKSRLENASSDVKVWCELHGKETPKVDVWAVGVLMYITLVDDCSLPTLQIARDGCDVCRTDNTDKTRCLAHKNEEKDKRWTLDGYQALSEDLQNDLGEYGDIIRKTLQIEPARRISMLEVEELLMESIVNSGSRWSKVALDEMQERKAK